ncbi:MAG: sensor domain-containing diguanylate cyclase [Elusimicrobiota bacterium]
MKRVYNEVVSGILIAVTFTVLTIALVNSPSPNKYLALYLMLEIIAFALFSLYGAVLLATLSMFVALGTLIIAESWFAVAAILTYWGIIIILNKYLIEVSREYGKQNLEIENKEKNLGELITEEEKFSQMIPILKEMRARYVKMAEFSFKLSTSFNDSRLYSFVLEYVRKFFPGKKMSLLTIPEDQYDKWVHEKKAPLLIENTFKDYRFKKRFGASIKSLIVCPLFQNNEVVGTIKLESKSSPFSHSDLRLLNVATTLSSIALEKARLFRRTQELAITDDLTGLYTHIYFKERLEEEVKRAARYNENFILLMLDIDNFKHFNDTYGHQTGDIVLKNVSDTIQQIVRETDVVGRYGGEEIAVILHNISKQKAKDIAERIRISVGAIEFVFDYRKVSVTVTVGAASFPENPTAEVLIMRADEALYTGKKKGKNRVIFSDTYYED